MSFQTSIQLVEDGDAVRALCEIRHPMTDTNYLTQVVFRVNSQSQAELLTGPSLSINPVVGTRLENLTPGDRIEVIWQDLSGASGRSSVVYQL